MHHSLAYELAARLWLPVLALVALIWLRVLLSLSNRRNRKTRLELHKAAEEEYKREIAKLEALR